MNFLTELNRKLSLHVRLQEKYLINTDNLNVNIERLHKRFDHVCVFESNENVNGSKNIQHSKIIAIGSTQELVVQKEGSALTQLQSFIDKNNSWVFGYITYDLKNEIEALSSNNINQIEFPALHFFVPQIVIQINAANLSIYSDENLTDEQVDELYQFTFSSKKKSELNSTPIEIQSKITKEEYIHSVNQLQQHIKEGNIYEVNFCREFFAENTPINPVTVYENLNSISEAPFSAFCKFNQHYLLSASPERFLKKNGNTLISQPIKGTSKRSKDKEEDELLKQSLKNNLKEQNENVMIVDLVRNDLSKIAKKGTVNVDELFGVYPFKQVHQMISTVSCELKKNISFSDILKATFPMGSMTGAPKVSAMKLIEEFETTKRGLYSGAVGYIAPNGDFDFSVVIRSILYNEKNNYVSFMVGSAITAKAEAEKEHEECLLKAKALFEALNASHYQTEKLNS